MTALDIPPGTQIQGYVIGEHILSTKNSSLYDASLIDGSSDPSGVTKFVFKYIHPTVSPILVEGECASNQALFHCPNLIVGFDFVQIEGSVGYFMRKCLGGDLLEFIISTDLDEPAVAQMSYRIFEAVAFMHSMGWAHRDIKPDNILLDGSDAVPDTFLTDLGFAAQGPRFTAPLGSLQYEAPELLAGQPYDTSVDIWACGVVLFTMLTRRWPFPDATKDPDDFYYRVQIGEWDADELESAGVSDMAGDLINRCLMVDPAQRLSATSVLQHPFFDGCRVTDVKATVETLDRVLDGQDGLDFDDAAT
jgi:serine/threonine protein kinase